MKTLKEQIDSIKDRLSKLDEIISRINTGLDRHLGGDRLLALAERLSAIEIAIDPTPVAEPSSAGVANMPPLIQQIMDRYKRQTYGVRDAVAAPSSDYQPVPTPEPELSEVMQLNGTPVIYDRSHLGDPELYPDGCIHAKWKDYVALTQAAQKENK